jgi:hypothetical protein
MSSPITLGDAYWEHQQLQKQISEQTKQTRLYADYDITELCQQTRFWFL